MFVGKGKGIDSLNNVFDLSQQDSSTKEDRLKISYLSFITHALITGSSNVLFRWP